MKRRYSFALCLIFCIQTVAFAKELQTVEQTALLKERFRSSMNQKHNQSLLMHQRIRLLNPQKLLGMHQKNIELLSSRLPASIENLIQHRREIFHSQAIGALPVSFKLASRYFFIFPEGSISDSPSRYSTHLSGVTPITSRHL